MTARKGVSLVDVMHEATGEPRAQIERMVDRALKKRSAHHYRTSSPRDGRSNFVSFNHVVDSAIGEAELNALEHSIQQVLQVLSHGAAKGPGGRFIVDGYDEQIEHAVKHLKRRGRRDRESGVDELVHAISRLCLAHFLMHLSEGNSVCPPK